MLDGDLRVRAFIQSTIQNSKPSEDLISSIHVDAPGLDAALVSVFYIRSKL